MRIRYFLAINDKSFSGNVAQYDQELKAIAGVGEVQVYPVWNGGGTVKCSVIDTELNIVTSDFLDLLQQAIAEYIATLKKNWGVGDELNQRKVHLIQCSV